MEKTVIYWTLLFFDNNFNALSHKYKYKLQLSIDRLTPNILLE